MKASHWWVPAILLIVGSIFAFPWLLYGWGLSVANGRPEPGQPTPLTSAAVRAAVSQCKEPDPFTVRRLDPVTLLYGKMFSRSLEAAPGERVAGRLALTHNAKSKHRSMFYWHLSGAALAIWITRNWTEEQIAGAAIRDRPCG